MTRVSIEGEKFLIDGRPTHQGRIYKGQSVEGLLFNTRMVQALFDDENPETAVQWAYPDTGVWSAERNLAELIEALPSYVAHGVDAITICLQGGMPVTGTEAVQPWLNTAFDPKGALKPAYLDRLRRLLAAADRAGMVVIVSYFYFGQDEYLADDAAVRRGTREATAWLLDSGFQNILVEVNNESDIPLYERAILTPPHVHELVALVRSMQKDGRRLPVTTSFSGGHYFRDVEKGLPPDAVIEVSDFILVHGNGWDERGVRGVVEAVRRRAPFADRPMPIVINEDSVKVANLFAALEAGAPWGYYDQGKNNYRDGFQSPPVNWSISTPEKAAFFDGVAAITGRDPQRPR